MRHLRRWAWAVVAVATTGAPALGQGGGGGGGGTGGAIGTPATTTTTGGFGGTSITGGSTGGTSGGNSGTTGSIGGTVLNVERAPVINAPSTYATVVPKGVQASNVFATTYANPLYSGTPAKQRSGTNPGGFGEPTFGTTGTTTGAAGAARTGGAGGATGQTADPGAAPLVALPRQISYTAQLKFAAPPPPAQTRLQAELSGMLARSGVPAGVQVGVDGRDVVLRGAVRDADEARQIEGMVRLTPGVGRIQNELAFPR
jgi:hypothetical protein